MSTLRRIALSSWPPMVVTIGLLAVLLSRYHLPLTDFALYVGYVLLAATLPGTAAWRALRGERPDGGDDDTTWFQDLSLGTIFGFAVQLPVYLLGVALGVPLLFWALPVLAVLSLALPSGRRVWTRPTASLDWRASWLLGGIILYGTTLFAIERIARKPLTMPRTHGHVDETFHLSLVGELMHNAPPTIPWVAGESINYHWFVHAQLAATTWGTGLDPWVMVRSLFPIGVIVLVVLGLGALALQATRWQPAAVIAPGLLVAGAFHVLGPHYNTMTFVEPFISLRLGSSPSFAFGLVMSMTALAATLTYLRQEGRTSWRLWLVLFLTWIGSAGAKTTLLPAAVCAAIGAWFLLAVLHRRIRNRAGSLALFLVGCLVFAQVVLLRGHTGKMLVQPLRTPEVAMRGEDIPQTALMVGVFTATLLMAWLLYGVGVVGLVRDGTWKDPRVLFCAVAVVTALTVPLVLYRPGWSQLWFSRAGAPVVVLLGTWGLARLLAPLTTRRAVGLALLALLSGSVALAVSSAVEADAPKEGVTTTTGVLLTLLLPVAVFAVGALLRLAPFLPTPRLGTVVVAALGLCLVNPLAVAVDEVQGRARPDDAAGQLFAKGGYEAARYVARHAEPRDLLATNAHCARPKVRCDNRHFWISGHTQRRVLIEGWGYTGHTPEGSNALSNRYAPSPFPARLAASDAAFEQPSAETIGALADEYDVDWLFVDKRYDVDMPALRALDGDVVDRRVENKNYAVFRILD